MFDVIQQKGQVPLGHRFRFIHMMLFSALMAVLLVCGTIANAQTTPLTPAELATIENQYARAATATTAMETKLQCFVTQDAQYEERSRVLQQETGELHRKETELQRALTVAREQEKGFSDQVAARQSEMRNHQRKMASLNASLRSANATLKKCKSDFWIFGFACDIAAEISGLKGSIRNLEAQQATTNIQLASAIAQYNSAQSRLQVSQAEHATAKTLLEQNQAAIRTSEAEIKTIKSALSNLRVKKQDYASTQSTFTLAYDDFKALDPNSERRYVIRQLRSASQDMAVALPVAEAIVNDGGLLLPSGTRICAN